VGDIAPTLLGVLAMRAVEAFSPRHANLGMAGDPAMAVTRVAVCTGSGRSLIDAARAAGADAYVTGDLTYHDADAAEGMGLVNVPHGAVEQHCMRAWAPMLASALGPCGVEVAVTSVDTDPWREAC
jgi:putative NIF3 family GTP cyclohydrolase 1 type 2